MRKVVAVSFVVVLLVNLFGYFISFCVQRYKIRAEVKQMLKLEKIKHTQQFVFTEAEYNQLTKYEGGREFRLNGGMYDVVKKELKDGKVVLFAYCDHKETGLLGKFLSYFNEENQPSQSTHRLTAFSLLEFVSPYYEWKCYNTLTRLPICHSYLDFLCQLSVDLVTPPPDLSFC